MHQPWMIGVARVPLTGEFVYVYFIGIAYHMLWGEEWAHCGRSCLRESRTRSLCIAGERSIPILRHFLWKEMIDK